MKDPYVYDGTTILINNFGLKDQIALDKTEADFVGLAANGLRKSDFEIHSILDCLEIHKRLFKRLYSWAGELRIIDIYKAEPLLGGKSIDYVFATYLQTALNELQKEYEAVKWDQLSSKEKIEKVCYFVSELWHIHPFREGNTRTTAMMLYFLIKKAGLHVNIDFLSRNGSYFRNALVLSCLYHSSKPEYLFGIVSDSAAAKNPVTGKYETIDGYEVAKYAYSNHTIEKMETIQKPSDEAKNGKNHTLNE